jgi:hypothetical protein
MNHEWKMRDTNKLCPYLYYCKKCGISGVTGVMDRKIYTISYELDHLTCEEIQVMEVMEL